MAALVAVFVGALGVTAVGEKNYFFRGWKGNVDDLIFNNDRNKIDVSKLEEAYKMADKGSRYCYFKVTIYTTGYSVRYI